jgi:hypothetical protein
MAPSPFDDTYWQVNYAEPEIMDGVVNADAHAAYVKASFDVAMAAPISLADFGFGLGRMFQAMLTALRPHRAYGLEPSPTAFEAGRYHLRAPRGTRLELEPLDLVTWCGLPDDAARDFDLGVCASVLQYLPDDDVPVVLATLARRCTWLYLSVPTAEEQARLHADHDFVDAWAHERPRDWYLRRISPHFDVVGARLLESRARRGWSVSPFTDHLFRA